MQIIKDRQVVNDSWQRIDQDTAINELPQSNIIVPATLWEQHKEALKNHEANVGIQLSADTDLETIAADLKHFAVIALEFPTFRDGRAYSLARRLREHYNYQGEIRAVGDVLRDQVGYMERVGFNAFEIDSRQKVEDALNAFKEINMRYQASSDQALPLYLRR